MKRHAGGLLAVLVPLLAGCSSPHAPSGGHLSGRIIASWNGVSGPTIAAATIRILDGPDAGRVATSDASGLYHLNDLTVATVRVAASASFDEKVKEVLVSAQTVLDFVLVPPVFVAAGSDNGTFTVPSWVVRARITGTYEGGCSYFMMTRSTSLPAIPLIPFVSVTLGTNVQQCGHSLEFPAIGTHYSDEVNFPQASPQLGTTVTVQAPDISWSFEEVRDVPDRQSPR